MKLHVIYSYHNAYTLVKGVYNIGRTRKMKLDIDDGDYWRIRESLTERHNKLVNIAKRSERSAKFYDAKIKALAELITRLGKSYYELEEKEIVA